MLHVNYKALMGTLKIAQKVYKKDENGNSVVDYVNKFTIDICRCNALAAFISKWKDSEGRTHRELWSLFVDRAHADRIWKNYKCFFECTEIAKIQLNLYYPNAKTLLSIFTRRGYKVEAYYKEPKREIKYTSEDGVTISNK